ncbi:MAG: NADH-quinone oxidoreductase subunit H [Acidobacteriota bacterium]|jgi:NADH-quinone oxidoreductase subunit H|nr:NADH-quinone oxidoreductase subunit H [Acidobacteriota bacterium]
MAASILEMIVFPGFVFLGILGMIFEYVDRILYARMQNRKGPPWYQPFADFIKLASKEDVIPREADSVMFKITPLLAATATVVASFYIPLWGPQALHSFTGDAVVVIYLLTIPTMSFFLAGWYSTSLYSTVGAVRTITQLFAYEVPLFLVILAPGILARTWSLSEMAAFYNQHPLLCLSNIVGFVVAIVALQGKLERIPFDIPEAETEIVAGTFTEYSGRLLLMFRLAISIETVVGAALISAVFLPFGYGLGWALGFVLFIVKVAFVMFILAVFKTSVARLRIEQMVNFCWRYVAPAAVLQLFISLILSAFIGGKGV